MPYPVLEYVINELSIENAPLATKEEAREVMEMFLQTCKEVRRIGFKKIRYAFKSIKNIPLTPDYTIQHWLLDEEVNTDLKDLFRRFTNDIGTPYIESENNAYYVQLAGGRQEEAKGLTTAYLKNVLCISFKTNQFWDTNNVSLIDLHNKTVVFQRHLCKVGGIDTLKRIFENNSKHGWCGKGEQKGQSRMLCCEEEHAIFLLNTAVVQPNKPENLCNYDTENQRFVEFYSHQIEEGKYHGYHYEDERTKTPARKLDNPKNGIPKKTQQNLKDMHLLYYSEGQL